MTYDELQRAWKELYHILKLIEKNNEELKKCQDRIEKLENMLRLAGYSSEQIAAGTPYIELMGT